MTASNVLPISLEQFGLSDHKLPLIFMREKRREMVLELQATKGAITMQKIRDIAAIQQAIKAIETVIAE